MKKKLMILFTTVALSALSYSAFADCYDFCEGEYAGVDWTAYFDCVDMCDACEDNGDICF